MSSNRTCNVSRSFALSPLERRGCLLMKSLYLPIRKTLVVPESGRCVGCDLIDDLISLYKAAPLLYHPQPELTPRGEQESLRRSACDLLHLSQGRDACFSVGACSAPPRELICTARRWIASHRGKRHPF